MNEWELYHIKQIIKREKTPFYVFFESKLKNNYLLLLNSFKKRFNNFQIAYSMKNCFIPGIIKVTNEFKLLYEVTSLYEMLLLHKMGINLNRCIYTNIYKSEESIEFAINNGLGLFAIDSYSDFYHIQNIAERLNRKVNVLLRVNPSLDIRDTVFASAVPWSKTGVEFCTNNPDCAENLIREIIANDYLILKGIHGHLGSQVTNITYYKNFIDSISDFFSKITVQYNLDMNIIDFGGGYPVKYEINKPIPSINEISQVISQSFSKFRISPYVIIETGRFITATAGILVSKVVGTKYNPSVGKMAILDISTYNHLLDSILVDWFFDVEIINTTKTLEKVHLVGCTNDSLDHLDPAVNLICPHCGKEIPRTRERKLPKINEGDMVVIKNVGAYTTCFNNNYCLLPLPPVFLVKENGKINMLRHREEFNHIMSLYNF